MKYILVLALPLWFLISACATEEAAPKHGTVLKEQVTKNTDGEVVSRYIFKYDSEGNITTIDAKSYNRWSTDWNIQYHNGKVSWVNNDSLVYENEVLTKTIYVGDDTTYIHAEFEIVENLLYKKTTYLWASGGYMLPGNFFIKPYVIDTVTTLFEYDEAKNFIMTNSESSIPFITPYEFSNLISSGEFSFDDKVSPYINFPLEIKFLLSINPGLNNVISRKLLGGTHQPVIVPITYEYNLDNLPVKSKYAVHEKLTTYYKYY